MQAAEGDLDPSFGTGGVVEVNFNGGQHTFDQRANAVDLTSDGVIAVAGRTIIYTNVLNQDNTRTITQNPNFLFAKFHPDGTPVNFGFGGNVNIDFGGDDTASDLAVDDNDSVVLVGRTSDGTNTDFALVRFRADGQLDQSFSGDGKVITEVGDTDMDDGVTSRRGVATAVAIQPDKKIVVAGYGQRDNQIPSQSSEVNNFALVRYNEDGTLDESFDGDTGNGNGIVATRIGTNAIAEDLVIQPDGKIIVVGEADNDFAVVRYHSDGRLDTSFDGDGIVLTNISPGDSATAVALQSDEKIVVVGARSGSPTKPVIMF